MFFGGKELLMFEGCVEDRKDPLQIGRVRVRIIGYHDADKQLMPTDTLPWANVLLPPDEGRNVVGYKEGDFVAGYFRDGESKQFPVIIGKLTGIPELPANPELGFNDPTPDTDLVPGTVARPPEMIPPPTAEEGDDEGETIPTGKYDNPNVLPIQATSTGQLDSEFGKKPFPYDMNGDGVYDARDASLLTDPDQDGDDTEGDFFDSEEGPEIQIHPISRYPLESRLKESNASRLARNENIDQTLVALKRGGKFSAETADHEALGVGTDAPAEAEAMSEPETPYNAKYPFNHVYESESGHVIETDDTPGVERTHRYHRSGTFDEQHPDGKQVNKAMADRYDLSLGTANYAAKKDVNISAAEFMRIFAAKIMNIKSGEDMNQDSGGDRNVLVGKNSNTRVKENVYAVIDGDVRILVKGNFNLAVEGDVKVKAKGDILMDGANTRITAEGQNILKAGQAVITEGPLTYTNTALTDGIFIHAKVADSAGVAESLGTIPPVPPLITPEAFEKENDADNKDNLVTSSSPKEGYLFNEDSMITGSPVQQDLYKPESDSDGKAVVLSLQLGQQARLYEAIPTGELEEVTIQYKHVDNSITEWKTHRPVHKKGRFIEGGKYSGNGNGGRDHWRFSKSGSKYPTSVILQIGSTEYLLVEAATRHEAL